MIHSTRVLRTALALAIALAPALPAAARTRPDPTPSKAASALSQIRIENFGQINANYYRGAQPEGRDYADLAALGVKTIIDLQEDGDPDEARLAQAAGLTYHRIPMSTRRAPTAEQLASFFDLVNDAAAQPVYVHCKGGRHRTGVMTAAYRMSFEDWQADRAYEEMKRFDFGPSFLHPEFKDYVYSYDPRSVTARTVAATTQQ